MSDGGLTFTPGVPPGFWTCPKGTPLPELARVFSVPLASCIEPSGREWRDEMRVFEDLKRACSFEVPRDLDGTAAADRLGAFRGTHPRSVVVIRDIPDGADARGFAAEAALAIGKAVPSEQAQSVVLEGWAADRVEVPGTKGRPFVPGGDVDAP